MDADLPEEGEGEYDPSFVITKLGAKVNSALVGGVIDRVERRETESGSFYTAHLRDPTGTHRFEVASFQPELHADIEEILNRFESGDRFLMLLVGRARWFETEDGGMFTSFRAEEFSIVDKDLYTHWLVEASEATLRRLDAFEASMESEPNPAALESAGVPSDLIEGMVLARGHYGEFDTENNRVGILQSLSMATGADVIIEAPSSQPTLEQEAESTPEVAQTPASTGDVSEVLLETIRTKDDGGGVDYDTLVHAAVMAGHGREDAEDTIDNLRDIEGSIIEPRFSFFRLTPE